MKDTSSSASRQHWIDTGEYLDEGDAWEVGVETEGGAAPRDTLADVRWSQERASKLHHDSRAFQQQRDSLMRKARSQGASLKKLSEASGLSIAQVQRICDLSKDRSE